MINPIKNKLELNYDSTWFTSRYYVYIIKIEVTSETYFYVGQTGDRHFVAARSPFYRLWGHFNPYNLEKGTDSQLMRNLFQRNIFQKKEGQSNRSTIDRALAQKDAVIKAQFYPIFDFEDENTQLNRKNHTDKRVFVEQIEKGVIEGLDQDYLFNDLTKKGFAKIKVSTEARDISDKILADFKKESPNS